jgi:hypothetical protein
MLGKTAFRNCNYLSTKLTNQLNWGDQFDFRPCRSKWPFGKSILTKNDPVTLFFDQKASQKLTKYTHIFTILPCAAFIKEYLSF